MSATLTAELLQEIHPPLGDVGERLACEFEREIQVAVGTCNQADARLAMLVRRGLLEGWWRQRGCHSPEHWVTAQLGLDLARAKRLVRIAMELGAYPETAAQFAAGQLTEAHVFEIVTRVDPASDAAVAGSAGHWNIGQLRRWSANFPKPVEPPRPEPEAEPVVEPEPFDLPAPDPTPPRAPDDRWWGQWNDQGRFVGGFDLGAELGSLMGKAMQAGRSRIFTDRTGIDLDDDDQIDLSGITQADVLRQVLHAGLAGLDPATAAGQRPGDRYQVLLHLDAEHPERSRLHLGPVLSKADREYLSCDADIRTVLWKDGSPVSVGRQRRTVDFKQRTLVEDRDRCCVVCGSAGFLHVHHEVFWEQGGGTDLANLFGVCPTDHKAIHRGDIQVVRDPLDPGTRIFLDRRGRPLPRPGPLPPPGGPPPAAPYRGPQRGRMPSWRYYLSSGRAA